MDTNNYGKKDKEESRTKIPFVKQVIEEVERTTYKKLKVDLMDGDEWRSIKVIELI